MDYTRNADGYVFKAKVIKRGLCHAANLSVNSCNNAILEELNASKDFFKRPNNDTVEVSLQGDKTILHTLPFLLHQSHLSCAKKK